LDPSAIENSIANMDNSEINEFDGSMDFEKFIVLSKKELANFCRITEPLTKASIDDYGKSVMIRCLDNSTVELCYYNNPYVVRATVENKSNKQVRSFAVSVATLKKIVTNAFASLVLVESENGDINLALCESLLYLETKNLDERQYNFTIKDAMLDIDKELAQYTFRKVGAILSQTDRASEKVVVIKDGKAHFNTGIFTSKSKSPFAGERGIVLYKQVIDVISTLAELTKVNLNYDVVDDKLIIKCDGSFYCEMPVGSEDKVDEFISPAAQNILNFSADISIFNDTFLRIVSIVKSLDYLSDIVTVVFEKDKIKLVIATVNQTKTSEYEFPIVEGKPETLGAIKLTVDVLQVFLNIVGADVKYQFTENGLGIKNDVGTFLIRRSH
jgi:hypothetical protein